MIGSPPTPDDLRSLERSWLSPDLIQRAFVRRLDEATAREVLGRSGSGDYRGVAFPYILPGEDRVREWRVRRDVVPLDEHGKPIAKYLGPPGRGNLLYFPPVTPPEVLFDITLPVAITEGEKKALALLRLANWNSQESRWLPIGLPGVWNWRGTIGKTTGPAGERCDIKGPIPDLDRVVWDQRKVFIIFDSNVATNESVQAARRRLADELRRRGATIFFVDLPEKPGINGVDDLLASEGPEVVLALFDEATECGEPDLLRYPYTDTGNAERFRALFGAEARYCVEFKKWLVWDGRRWAIDDVKRVKALAKRTMRRMYEQATVIQDEDERKRAERHARRSEQARAIRDMLTCLEYEPGLAVRASELDSHPHLLNCLNGTLNLKTGELRPHRRQDLLTKLVHFNYNPSAKPRLFLSMLYRIMSYGHDADEEAGERAERLVSYLQKAFGMSLTGDVSAKVVFCFFGTGNNGKTTLLEIVRFVLAEYSAQIMIDSLMHHARGHSNAILSDLADLRGARFVTTSEAEEGQRLAEGKLKYLSAGMGQIKTCRKYENPVQFEATHKLFLDANHRPVVRGTDAAIWTRLKCIPFPVTIPRDEIDQHLLDKLKGEGEGILAWMVTGCRNWLKEGLQDPPEVTAAGRTWRDEMDPLRDFLEDCSEVKPEDPNTWCWASELWESYENWGRENGEKVLLSRRRLAERLELIGCKRDRRYDDARKQHRTWEGIALA